MASVLREKGVWLGQSLGSGCIQFPLATASSKVESQPEGAEQGLAVTCTLEEWNLVHELGEALRNSLTGVGWDRPGTGAATERERGCHAWMPT